MEKRTVEYSLTTASGSSKDIPVEAKEIVNRHLERWKATFSP